MNRFKPALFLIFVLTVHITSAQTNACECSIDPSLSYKTDYPSILPASILKKNGVTQVNIQTQDNNRPRVILRFDANGQLISRTEYRNYPSAALYTFKRNTKGQVTQQIESDLDSLEKKKANTSDEITDYTYDGSGRLIKIKKRNMYGKVVADELSEFTTYAYDNRGRKLEEFQFNYFDHDQSVSYKTKYTYDDKKFESQNIFYSGKKVMSKETSTYSANWMLLTTTRYDKQSKKLMFEEHFEYDPAGKLITYKTRGSFSECVDNGDFTDTYEYDSAGLLQTIIHTYGNNTCKAKFEYIRQ